MFKSISKLSVVVLLGIMIGLHTLCLGQAGESGLKWKRDIAAAVAEARQGSKGVLVFFYEASSVSANRMWKSLADGAVVAELERSFIPVFVDMEAEKTLAGQLGVSEPGVVIVYDNQGRAVTPMLKEKDLSTADGLRNKLRSVASQQGLGKTGAAPSASVTATPAHVASPPVSASSSAAGGAETSPGQFPNAIPADQVQRDAHLGKELAVTGRIVIFEASTAKNRPNIMTLTKRAEDPVQIVYWEQAAEGVHKGRPVPKEGDLVSVRGKLTDYRGRLQFKVDQPEQMRYLPQQ